METHYIRISTISKTQLALLYFPDQPKKIARQTLMRLILRDSSLCEKLQKTVDFRSCRILTPMQIEDIYKHLGNPTDFVYQRSFDEEEKKLAYGVE